MKKLTALLVLVALCATMVFSLTACNTAAPTFEMPAEFDAEAFMQKEITITFSHTMGSNLTDVLDPYIAEFNELYPNIHVEDTQVGGYDDVRNQISTDITVGKQPNVAYCYPDHVALYNKAKAVATLDELIASQIEITRADGSKEIIGLTEAQIADFIEGYYNEGKQFGDGLMYTMPFSKSTEVLYYNVNAFREAGLVDGSGNVIVPDHWFSNGDSDKTSMEYVCKTLKTYNPDCIPLGYDSEANWFITMCEQMGSDYTTAEGNDHFLFNNKQNRDLMAKFRTWYENGWLTTQQLYGGYTSGAFIATTGTKSYMSIGSSAGATHQRPEKVDGAYPFEVGIASIPQMDANNPKVISQGPSVCIFTKEDPDEVIATWLFVKFLTTSVEFQAEFGMASGYVPVLKSVSENATYSNFIAKANQGNDQIAALSAKVCLEQENAYYTSPAFNGSSKARDEVGSLLSKCLAGELDGKTVDQFIKAAFEEAIENCEY